jgi:VWFA-related protein
MDKLERNPHSCELESQRVTFIYIALTASGYMRGEAIRAIGISILALMIAAIIGCAIKQSPQPPSGQAGSNSPPLPLEGSCKRQDAPPAEVAHKSGYRQFDVSVTNSIGWPVSGLTQQDFVLYAGSQTLPIAYFREHKNDEPVAIALVVDASGSMASKLPIVEQSLGDFVQNLNPCDEVALFAFNSQVYLLQPSSTDHQMAAERMKLLHAYGKSALYDATDAALQSLERADNRNRKLILIADGMDNSSATSEKDIVARATKDGIPIYAIGIGDPNAPEKSGVNIGPIHIVGESYIPSGEPIVVGPPGIGEHTGYVPGIQPAWSGTDRVDAKSIENLSAMAGGRSFIVPSRGEVGGKSFETAIFAIADNIAKGYAISAVVPDDASPSTVKVTVVKRLDLDVRAHPTAPLPQHD